MKFPWLFAGALALATPAAAQSFILELKTEAYDMDACFAVGEAVKDFIGRPVEYRCRPDETGGGAARSVDPPATGKGVVLPDPPMPEPSLPVPGTLLLPLESDPSREV